MASKVVNIQDFSPAGDGDTDDQSALQSALDAAQSGVLLFPDADKVYALHGFGLTIHENTRIINPGATLLVRGNVPHGSKASAIVAEDGLQVDRLRVHADTGSRVNRVLTLGADTSIERLEISSDSQQDNMPAASGDPLPAALHIRGDRTTLGHVAIRNFDRAVFALEVDRVAVQRFDIQSYVTAINLRRCAFVELASGVVTDASPTDVGDREDHDTVKGMNGLLIDECHDLVISDLIVHDSIEHGVRIGGNGPSRRCTFSNIQVHRPGWCGLKVQPDFEDGGSAKRIQINGLMVTDCAPKLPDQSEARRMQLAGGRNRSGLRLETCQDIVVNGLQICRGAKQFYSAYHGIYIARCKDVTVNAPQISDTYLAGIKLSDSSDASSVTHTAVNEIYIRDPSVTFLVPEAHADPAIHGKNNGIEILSEIEYLRNIAITGCYLRGHTGYGVHLAPRHGRHGGHGVRWPLILQGWVKEEGKGIFHTTAHDIDIHNLLESV